MRIKKSLVSLGMCVAMMAMGGASHAASATYTYDALGRLVTVTYSNGTVITYTYDAAGNRTTVVTTGAP